MQRQLMQSMAVLVLALAACADEGPADVDPADVGTTGVRATDHDLTFTVDLRPRVTADLHVRVFVDEARPCAGPSLLAIHGLSHTAATWQPFAEALFAAGGPCRVYAVDLPGHGGSGLPRGLRFSDLVLEDYTTAVVQTLQRLERDGAAVRAVIGHSMGGLLIQQAQARLRAAGSGLAAHGVVDAVLIASTAPSEVAMQCGVRSGGGPALGPGSYLRADATRGLHLAIPDDTWRTLFFSDRAGALVPSAPAAAEVAAYNAVESLPVAASVLGLPFARPSIAAGVFADSGVALTVAAFEQDPFGTEPAQQCLLDHLAGAGRELVVVRGPESVHDAYVAVPDDVVAALRLP